MTCRAKMIGSIALAILIALCALTMTLTTMRDLRSLRKHVRTARSLGFSISELTLLTRKVMHNPSEQSIERWHATVDTMRTELGDTRCQHEAGGALARDILSSLNELNHLADRHFEGIAAGPTADPAGASGEMAGDSWAALFAHLGGVSLAVQRFQQVHADLFSTATDRVIAGGIGSTVLMLLLLIASVIVLNLSTVRPLRRLQQGMEAVADGNLAYRVGTKRRDEFGMIERAFDDMTVKLQNTLASREELRQEVKQREKIEDELHERIKELDCLRETERILADRTLSRREVMRRIVDLLPASWLYSETACAQITLDTMRIATDHDATPCATQVADITLNGKRAGQIEVGYLEEHPTADEGPFLNEERELLDSLADRIGHHLEQSRILSESETRFRQLLTLAPIPMAHVNRDGDLIYINNRFTELYGYDLDDVPNLDAWWPLAFPDPEYRQGALETWSADVEKAEKENTDIHPREYRLTCKDGTVRFAEIGGVLVDQEYMVTFIDRTDRDQALRSLRESEERFRLLSEASLTGISIIQDGTYVEVNPAFAGIFSYERDEIINRLGPMDLTIPEDRPAAQAYLDRIGAGKPTEDVLSVRARKQDGSIVWLEIRAGKTHYQGGPAIIVNTVDVTERRQWEMTLAENERRYRGIFDTAPVSIWEEDWTAVISMLRAIPPEHLDDVPSYLAQHPEFVREAMTKVRIVDVNEATVSMFGAQHKTDLLDSLETVFAAPGTLDGFAGELTALASGESFYKSEMQLCTVDGRNIHALVTMAFPEPESSSGTVLLTLMDLTARKTQEEQQKRLTQELERKNRELSQVIYVTSHDLRSPLVNIQGFSRELKASLAELSDALDPAVPSDDSQAQIDFLLRDDIPGSLDYILNSAARMDRLLTGLLKISRLGRAALTVTDIDMNELLPGIVESLQFQLRELGGQVTLDELPACRGDAGQIEQVFSNLLDNAVKYASPDRHLRIHVSGHRTATQAVYCVADNGCGIDPNHQEKIFELFHRLSPKDSDGEGLGLTSVRTILHRHGGKIWVDSEPGRGSSFHVCLPLEPAGNGTNEPYRNQWKTTV